MKIIKSMISRPAVNSDDGYLSKVIKYIPAEISAVYVFIAGIISGGNQENEQQAFAITLIALMILTPVWIYLGVSSSTPLPPKRQRIYHALVALLALLVWVYNIDIEWTSAFFGIGADATMGAIVLALFTLAVPILEKLFVPSQHLHKVLHPDELKPGEKYPNVPEKEAVGALVKKIERGTPEFNALVKNTNGDIVFKNEEGTDADRMMTSALNAKCNALATLVKTEWPGIKLRVTEAWDEDDEHSPDSLHYEARSADLTTSDKDGRKLGRLGGLSIQAGFGWVYFEGNHIHASVPK